MQKNQAFRKHYMKVAVKKLSRAGMMPARTWGVSPCSGDGSHGQVEIEKTDGSSSRQQEYDFSVLVHGSIWLGSRGGTFYFSHSVLGRRSMIKKMELRAKRSLDEVDSRGSNVKTSERARRSSDVRDP